MDRLEVLVVSVGGIMAFGGINGMADSLLNQAIDGKFSLGQTLFDGLIGMATAGLLHGAGKVISKVSPYVTESIGKVFSKLSGEARSALEKVSGKVDDILNAFRKTGRELFEKAANKANNVVNSIKESAEELVDRAANKFNEVTTNINSKIHEGLQSAASKADDALNTVNDLLGRAEYNINKSLGMQKAYVGIGDEYVSPPKTNFFENQISKMDGKGNANEVITSDILKMKPKDVPSIRNGEFNKWFNELSEEDLNEIFTNPKLQKVKDTVKDRIRHPGGLHEWLMCEKAPKIKSWGITMEKIKELRTATKDTNFLNPAGTHHCSAGGKKAHKELAKLIDESNSFEEFRVKLSKWADKKVEGGRDALPEGLRVSE